MVSKRWLAAHVAHPASSTVCSSVCATMLTIIQKFNGGPVGLDTLAASTSEDTETIEDVYEPYLLQLGFIARTPRGRIVTRLAYQHLGFPAPGGGNGLGPGLWQS